jgi:hypothetical protein
MFLQHFENKLFQTIAQTLRQNMARVVTSLLCSRTSSPADLPRGLIYTFSLRRCAQGVSLSLVHPFF